MMRRRHRIYKLSTSPRIGRLARGVIFYLTVVAAFVFLINACSKSKNSGVRELPDSGDAALESTDGSVTEKDVGELPDAEDLSDAATNCTSEITQITSPILHIPDEATVVSSVPIIKVSPTDLYYLLSCFIKGDDTPYGYLMRVPIRGGESVRMAVVSGGGLGSQELAVTSEAVVFSESRDGIEGAIGRVPLEGGETTTITGTNGVSRALVADNENVYFVDEEATKRVSLDGGKVQTLTSERPYSIGLVGQNLLLASPGTAPGSGTVSSVPIEGGQVTVLAREQRGPLFPVGCGTNIYWVSIGPWTNGQLMQLKPEGEPIVLAEGLNTTRDIVCDGENLFVAYGSIVRIPLDGGDRVTVETESAAEDVELDRHCIYWSNLNGIYSLALSVARGDD
ncbi:MAG: hypothetical protein JXA30_11605 [Deltaproteobacteria bacterium]|nr:hypothetical protein [Deltaproteobacteria bacterium]